MNVNYGDMMYTELLSQKRCTTSEEGEELQELPQSTFNTSTTSLRSQSNLCPQPAALLLTNPSRNQLVKERQGKRKMSFLGREDLTTGSYFLFQFARDRIRFPFRLAFLLLYLEQASLYPFHL